MAVSIISLVIGVAALTASLVALWRTQFSGFQPKAIVGPLTLRIFPITNDGSKWFIASFLSSLTVTNNGASPGAVIGLRLKLQFSELKADAFETIPVSWEMDSADLLSIDRDRFRWLEKAVRWRPFIVLPRETQTQHVLLESRWEEPIVHPLIQVSLELAHDHAKGRWQPVGTWSLHLDEAMWAELANVGTSVTMPPGDEAPNSPEVEPEDLHDLLRPAKPIPDKGFDAGPSYLDFPDD